MRAVLVVGMLMASALLPALAQQPVVPGASLQELDALRAIQGRENFRQQQQFNLESDRQRVQQPMPRPQVPMMRPSCPGSSRSVYSSQNCG